MACGKRTGPNCIQRSIIRRSITGDGPRNPAKQQSLQAVIAQTPPPQMQCALFVPDSDPAKKSPNLNPAWIQIGTQASPYQSYRRDNLGNLIDCLSGDGGRETGVRRCR